MPTRWRKNSSVSKDVTGDTVLIAAFSGRALAQSARRAGYEPLVADAFGDLDTRDAATAFRAIDGAMQTGFHTKSLIQALDALASAAPSPPIGLVLGSGFEDKPRLVAALAKPISACSARTLRRTDPAKIQRTSSQSSMSSASRIPKRRPLLPPTRQAG